MRSSLASAHAGALQERIQVEDSPATNVGSLLVKGNPEAPALLHWETEVYFLLFLPPIKVFSSTSGNPLVFLK